jgi:hypothetical protein
VSDDHVAWMRPAPEQRPGSPVDPAGGVTSEPKDRLALRFPARVRGGAYSPGPPGGGDRKAPSTFRDSAAAVPGAQTGGRRRLSRGLAVVAASVLVVAGGVVAVRAVSGEGNAAPQAAADGVLVGQSQDPEDQAWKVAQAQVDALLMDNEQAWLALLDPAQPQFVDRYRVLFRTLRALKVNQAEALATAPPGGGGDGSFYVGFSYCFAGSPCPATIDQAKMVKRVAVKTVVGRLVVSTLDWNPDTIYNLPDAPWADDQLVFAEGKRVVVGGPASQARNVDRVVAYGDRAAADLDRYGDYLRTAQDRYRIFLADDKQWATWYGGDQPTWAIGYAWEPAGSGMDVILHASRVLDGSEDAQKVVRHEMGHVLTTIQAKPPENPLAFLFNDPNQWLREGIAEYLGQNARPPQQTDHRYALQRAFASATPPRSVMARAVDEGSSRQSVHSLYAMGYFAVSCMAASYGEAKMFHFTDLVLRDATTADTASRAVYGKPFRQVDRACLGWIKQRL